MASVWPGADWIAPALLLAVLAGVIGHLYARVGRAIDELLNEQRETNP